MSKRLLYTVHVAHNEIIQSFVTTLRKALLSESDKRSIHGRSFQLVIHNTLYSGLNGIPVLAWLPTELSTEESCLAKNTKKSKQKQANNSIDSLKIEVLLWLAYIVLKQEM